MKKIFAALLAVLFITGAVLGCGKTPQTELNQAKQQAAEQVAKTAPKVDWRSCRASRRSSKSKKGVLIPVRLR